MRQNKHQTLKPHCTLFIYWKDFKNLLFFGLFWQRKQISRLNDARRRTLHERTKAIWIDPRCGVDEEARSGLRFMLGKWSVKNVNRLPPQLVVFWVPLRLPFSRFFFCYSNEIRKWNHLSPFCLLLVVCSSRYHYERQQTLMKQQKKERKVRRGRMCEKARKTLLRKLPRSPFFLSHCSFSFISLRRRWNKCSE